MAAAGGRHYYEVYVLEAGGFLCVGFAGTNLGLQCAQVGDDACSWGFYMGDGDGRHRCSGEDRSVMMVFVMGSHLLPRPSSDSILQK